MKLKDKRDAETAPIKIQQGRILKASKRAAASLGTFGRVAITRNFPVGITPHLLRLASPRPGVPALVATLTKYFKVAGNAFLIACIVFDTYRVAAAVGRDVKRRGKLGKRSAKTTASIGSSWVVSTAGVYGGGVTGAWVGGSVGSAFGGVGAVPGAAIGSLIGGLIGGVIGTFLGKTAGEAAVDIIAGGSDSESDDEEYSLPKQKCK
jgi:hypothetical protein